MLRRVVRGWVFQLFIIGGSNFFLSQAFSFSSLASHYRRRAATQLSMTFTSTTKSTTFINSIQDIVDNYDLFLLDMWGVMHDGSKPYQGVLETVRKLKENEKNMIILSNSSKRTESSIRALTKLGFDVSDFEQIITSGEVSF